jgi:hypoxanthine-DNA glycosylase
LYSRCSARRRPWITPAAAHGIGLCYVVAVGRRDASADATIRLEEPNPIPDLLDYLSRTRAVAFNGSGAERLHDRHFARRSDLAYLSMPSSSPAHARLDLNPKLARWEALRASRPRIGRERPVRVTAST